MCAEQWGNLPKDENVVELLRIAILQGNQQARVKVQQYLRRLVRGWILRHPNRAALYSLDNEEIYIDRAFERFWRLTIDQQIVFNTLTTALQYLWVCLNGAILDRLRASSCPNATILPLSVFPEELLREDTASSAWVWERLQKELLNTHERRLAFLLFHCGFNPGEIVHYCSQEFNDVGEIYRLRCNIIARLKSNRDCLQ